MIERAFEPFFTTKESGQGTGLGLSQVYGFMKQSGGHAKIYSEPGEGTTVKNLAALLRQSVWQPKRKRPQPRRGCSGESVLVVEDDSDVRDYVVETLASLGYKVFEAGEAESAAAARREPKLCNLLLTDVVMPGMNGRKLAEEARLRRPGPENSVYDRLFAQCHHAPRPARYRRRSAAEADQQRATRHAVRRMLDASDQSTAQERPGDRLSDRAGTKPGHRR